MSFSTLKLKQEGALLRVAIANPPINLVSEKMVGELFELAGKLQMDKSVKVVLIESDNPDFFVAHFDLNDLPKGGDDPSKASKSPHINAPQSLALTWQLLPQVKIAKVDGRCRGVGVEFILALDMRFATLDSKFCLPEASGGFLACGGGATRTLLAAGPARGLEFLLSSRDFSGEEAERYGLVNRALPKAELDAYLEDLIARLVQRSPEVVGMHREVIRKTFEAGVESMFAGFAAENAGMRAALAGGEMIASIKAHMALGQTRDIELDLPASMAAIQTGKGV